MKKNIYVIYMAVAIVIVFFSIMVLLFSGTGKDAKTSAYKYSEIEDAWEHDTDDSKTNSYKFTVDSSFTFDVDN